MHLDTYNENYASYASNATCNYTLSNFVKKDFVAFGLSEFIQKNGFNQPLLFTIYQGFSLTIASTTLKRNIYAGTSIMGQPPIRFSIQVFTI